MSELPGLSGLPKPIVYKTNYNIWVPELAGLHVSDHLLPNYDSSDDNSNRKKRTAKRSKKDKKKHSRSSKRMRQYGLEGYILQVIGMLCFVLAAIKAFEPLTGVGFTLVLIGYNKNARKEARVGKSHPIAAKCREELMLP